jgi:hypothetical protein
MTSSVSSAMGGTETCEKSGRRLPGWLNMFLSIPLHNGSSSLVFHQCNIAEFVQEISRRVNISRRDSTNTSVGRALNPWRVQKSWHGIDVNHSPRCQHLLLALPFQEGHMYIRLAIRTRRFYSHHYTVLVTNLKCFAFHQELTTEELREDKQEFRTSRDEKFSACPLDRFLIPAAVFLLALGTDGGVLRK